MEDVLELLSLSVKPEGTGSSPEELPGVHFLRFHTCAVSRSSRKLLEALLEVNGKKNEKLLKYKLKFMKIYDSASSGTVRSSVCVASISRK